MQMHIRLPLVTQLAPWPTESPVYWRFCAGRRQMPSGLTVQKCQRLDKGTAENCCCAALGCPQARCVLVAGDCLGVYTIHFLPFPYT